MISRAQAVASTLAALLTALLAGAPAAPALTVPGLPVPSVPGVPAPRTTPTVELRTPTVEVHTPLPVEAKTPVVSVSPAPGAGVTATVPTPSGGATPPPVEVPPAPPPPLKVPLPPPVKAPLPAPVPGAGPPATGTPGTGRAGGPGAATAASVGAAAAHAVNSSTAPRTPAAPGASSRSHTRTTTHAGGAAGGRAGQVTGGSGGAKPGGPAAGTPAVAAAAITPPAQRAGAGGDGDPLTSIGRNIPFPVPVPDWSKPIILALLLLALALALRAGLTARRARRLERQREGLLQDIDAMQAALVPEIPPQLEGLAVSVAYRPAEGPAAGGDFYDVFSPAPGRVAVILGDVAGHGHEALRHAALIRYTLRAYLQAGLEPRTALALAGRALDQPVGEYCATVAVGVYDRRGSRLTYALAGHPAPILRGVPAPEPLTACSSPPIGWSLPTGLRQSEVTLPPGSEVCFFSDGLIEARTGGGFVGRDGLRAMLEELGARTSARALLERVQALTQATPDDMAACVLAPQTHSRHERWHVEELETDRERMEGGAGRRFLEACTVAPPLIEQTLELAESILASSPSVVLRVQSSSAGTTVRATAPRSRAPGAGEAARAGSRDGYRSRRAADASPADDGPALLR